MFVKNADENKRWAPQLHIALTTKGFSRSRGRMPAQRGSAAQGTRARRIR